MEPEPQPSAPAGIEVQGRRLFKSRAYQEAEALYLSALALGESPALYNNCGYALEMQGKFEAALDCYRKALLLEPEFEEALANRSSVAKRLNLYHEVVECQQILTRRLPNNAMILNDLANAYLRLNDHDNAARIALLHSWKTRGSKYVFHDVSAVKNKPSAQIGKIQHDVEQLEYLHQLKLLPEELHELPDHYKRALEIIEKCGSGELADKEIFALPYLSETYERIVYKHPAERCSGRVLTDAAKDTDVQAKFAGSETGVVVIDDFLTEEALKKLQEFCLLSTIWNATKYRFGRLGALFRDGFNAPLLFQIANELAATLPSVVGTRFPLLHMWAFKYRHDQPSTTPHADFAAINVNFWITPDHANLDNDSGGLVVYGAEAPRDWDFDRYNRQGKSIEEYLDRIGASSIRIPYRCNRAIIFNSDLYHKTEPMTFRQGYLNRRMNVTFLFGDRRDAF